MSGKQSDRKFFFADYGCCISTESYAWILVVLFITAILVLLFCMLATATIRWMYKRRMRKRLQDLKHKFQLDHVKAVEFEAKLNSMAQKYRNSKTPQTNNDSKEGKSEKLTINVDLAQNAKQKKTTNQKQNKKQFPEIDLDETPIAQSTLATPLTNPVPNEDRWFVSHQKALHRPFSSTPPAQGPGLRPADPLFSPPKQPITDTTPMASPLPGHLPPKRNSKDFIPQPPKKNSFESGQQPMKKNSKELAPPPTTSSAGSLNFTTSGFTTTPSTVSTGTSPGSTVPQTTPSTTNSSNKPSDPPSDLTQLSPPSPPPKAVSEALDENPDDVKANLQYKQDNIVSPRVSDKAAEDRNKGGGGKSEWKYYYANMSGSDAKKGPSSSVTKSSGTSRPSSRSWLFDSTGSNRFENAREGTSRSSSLIKTDSSQYRTASVECFPHGAFTLQE